MAAFLSRFLLAPETDPLWALAEVFVGIVVVSVVGYAALIVRAYGACDPFREK